jgi:hypothetical protein
VVHLAFLCVAVLALLPGAATASASSGPSPILVDGPITSDTTWTADAGPYVLVGEVRIREDATLHIHPGVIVLGTPASSLIVERGTLRAIGRADAPIRFEAEGDGASWDGIVFEVQTRGARFDGVGRFIRGSIVQHAVLRHTREQAIRLNLATPYLADLAFLDHEGRGILGSFNWSRQVRIERCRFVGCRVPAGDTSPGGGAIALVSGRGHRIIDCVFEGNVANADGGPGMAGGAAVDLRGSDALVRGCRFIDNGTPGAESTVGGLYLRGDRNVVERCTFIGNRGRVGAISTSGSFSTLIADCTIIENVGTTSAGGISASGDEIRIVDTVVRGNRGNRGGGLRLRTDRVEILGSSIVGNHAGRQSDGVPANGGGATVWVERGSGSVIRDTVFSGNAAEGDGGGLHVELRNGEFPPGPSMNLQRLRVEANVAGGDGGGLFILPDVRADGLVITDNLAGADGGGVMVARIPGPGDPAGIFRMTRLTRNAATRGGGLAWGMAGGAAAAPTGPDGDEPGLFLAENRATLGSAIAVLADGERDGSTDVDGRFVDLGTTDRARRDQLVHDALDDPDLALWRTGPSAPLVVDASLRWTAADSPIRVDRSIVVGAGAELVIEAGVTVEFAPGAGLDVGTSEGAGGLRVLGTPGRPVRFVGVGTTTASPLRWPFVDPGGRTWTGIRIGPAAIDVVRDELGDPVAGTFLRHAILEGVAGGLDALALGIDRSSVMLDGVVVRGNSSRGIDARLSSVDELVVRACRIEENEVTTFSATLPRDVGLGLRVVGGGRLTIDRTVFLDNAIDGAEVAGLFVEDADVTITRSEFRGNRSNGQAAILMRYLSGLRFEGNTVADSQPVQPWASGGDGMLVGAFGGTTVIRDCDFTGNVGRGLGVWIASGSGSAIVTDCRFEGRAEEPRGSGAAFGAAPGSELVVSDNLFTGLGQAVRLAAGVRFERNRVIGNRADNGPGLWIFFDPDDGDPPLIVDNEIRDNHASEAGGGILVLVGSARVAGNRIIGNSAGAVGGGIAFWYPGAGLDLSLDPAYGPNIIRDNIAPIGSAIHMHADASANVTAKTVCWGTTDLELIDAMIDDGRDDAEPGRGVVYVVNPLDGAACAAPTCPGDLDRDGRVGLSDLVAVLGTFGPCTGCAEDLDGDGAVDAADVAVVLGVWGVCGAGGG